MINYGEGGIDHDLCMTSIHIVLHNRKHLCQFQNNN